MQKLEDELNLKIFNRKASKIALNKNGIELLDYAKDIIKMNNLLIQKAKELKENEKVLAIGYSAPGPLYKYKKLFDSSMNKIKTSLNTELELIEGLLNNTFDIIFINRDINLDDCIFKKLFKEKLYISIPKTHFLAGIQHGVHWHDIDGQSFLLFSYI